MYNSWCSIGWIWWYVYVKIIVNLNCMNWLYCTLHGMVGLETETVKLWVHTIFRQWPYCGKRRSDLDPEGKHRWWNFGSTISRRWPYYGKRRSDLDPEWKHRWWNLGSTSRYRIRIRWVVLWVTCIIVHVMYVCWCVWLCANVVVVWIMVMCQGCEYSDNRFTWLMRWKWIPWVRIL